MIRTFQILFFLSLCVFLSHGYMIDEANYFYINSSYGKQTASFSMCFHFQEPATIQFESPMLGTNESSIIFAVLNDQKSIKFTPAFDGQLVGYNNYDSGEYWFGVKLQQKDNTKQDTFQKIKLTIKIGQDYYQYVFLSPLFALMLNAFEVYPTNTLYSYSNWLLISYLYKVGEADAFIFEKKGQNNYKILEEPDWGFKREDSNVNYQRHKSKKSDRITVQIRKPTSKSSLYLEPKILPANPITLPQINFSFSMEALMGYAVPIGVIAEVKPTAQKDASSSDL